MNISFSDRSFQYYVLVPNGPKLATSRTNTCAPPTTHTHTHIHTHTITLPELTIKGIYGHYLLISKAHVNLISLSCQGQNLKLGNKENLQSL